MTPPQRTPDQLAAALLKAGRLRAYRSQLKDRVKQGTTTITQALDDPDAGGMRVDELLRALPGVGRVRAGQAMQRAGIAADRRVQGLGARQRRALEAQLAPAAA